jgi:hypothetical protein
MQREGGMEADVTGSVQDCHHGLHGASVHQVRHRSRLAHFFCDQFRYSLFLIFDAIDLLALSSPGVRKMTLRRYRLQELFRP